MPRPNTAQRAEQAQVTLDLAGDRPAPDGERSCVVLECLQGRPAGGEHPVGSRARSALELLLLTSPVDRLEQDLQVGCIGREVRVLRGEGWGAHGDCLSTGSSRGPGRASRTVWYRVY